MKKDKSYLFILLGFIFMYLWAASFVADQKKIESSGLSLNVIAPVSTGDSTNKAKTHSVLGPNAFLLTESASIGDDDDDNLEWTGAGFETSLSFFSLTSIHPVFTEGNSNGSLASQAPRPPPFI